MKATKKQLTLRRIPLCDSDEEGGRASRTSLYGPIDLGVVATLVEEGEDSANSFSVCLGSKVPILSFLELTKLLKFFNPVPEWKAMDELHRGCYPNPTLIRTESIVEGIGTFRVVWLERIECAVEGGAIEEEYAADERKVMYQMERVSSSIPNTLPAYFLIFLTIIKLLKYSNNKYVSSGVAVVLLPPCRLELGRIRQAQFKDTQFQAQFKAFEALTLSVAFVLSFVYLSFSLSLTILRTLYQVFSSIHAGVLRAFGDIDPKLEYGPCAIFLLYHDESIDLM
ncbi:hypothetical protein Tco_1079009 [Tanacetum coccineum]|uniref:Uncharacterized protein n=1 Tax=Tanacetum coccineum TaxID=301880 RepID=A0ABQ5HRZ1_9ASTR